MEDPKEAVGLVKRAVTRIITPGTLIDAETLDRHSHNYLMVAYYYRHALGLCFCDISTGRLETTEIEHSARPEVTVLDWVESKAPSELILVEDADNSRVNV